MRITIDFETTSGTDLKECGAARYWECATTEVVCLKLHTPSHGMRTWRPEMGRVPWLVDLVENVVPLFEAHNVSFEKNGWRQYMMPVFGFPDIPNHRWRDTMAVAAYKAMPQALDDLLVVLRLPQRKDKEGSSLTTSLSRCNRKGYVPKITPEVQTRVETYCESDVVNEMAASHRLGDLTPDELQNWLDSEMVNERGIQLDLAFVDAALEVVEKAKAPLLAEFRALVQWPDKKGVVGPLNPTQLDKFKEWLAARNVTPPDLAKETVNRLLGIRDEDDELEEWDEPIDLPADARRALEIKQVINSSSIKKLGRMKNWCNADGRSRWLLQYHGTGPGRVAGRGWQPTNLPRPTIKCSPDVLVAAIMSRDADYIDATIGPPIEVVSSSLRHAIIAKPGHVLMAGDYSGIQARVVLALAGQMDKVALMAAGQDVYCDFASVLYGRPIIPNKHDQPPERHDGKGGVLGCGFQMGAKRFWLKECPDKPFEFAEKIINTYRKEWAPEVPKLWRGLSHAAVQTVHTRKPHEAYGIEYRLEDGWLSCRAPSGRKMWYWNPQPIREPMPWGCAVCDGKLYDECHQFGVNHTHEFVPTDIRPAYTYQAQKVGVWKTIKAFGGMNTENCVMAIERDIMAHGRRNLEREGFPVILEVYDEAVCEVPEGRVDEILFRQCMEDTPAWVKTLQIPVAVELWDKPQMRYRK